MARAGMPGVPFAEGSSLGRAVAGTVSAPWLIGCLLAHAGQLAGCAAAGCWRPNSSSAAPAGG